MQGVSRVEHDDVAARVSPTSSGLRHVDAELVSAGALRAESAEQFVAAMSETPTTEPQHIAKARATLFVGPANDDDLTAEAHTPNTSTRSPKNFRFYFQLTSGAAICPILMESLSLRKDSTMVLDGCPTRFHDELNKQKPSLFSRLVWIFLPRLLTYF